MIVRPGMLSINRNLALPASHGISFSCTTRVHHSPIVADAPVASAAESTLDFMDII